MKHETNGDNHKLLKKKKKSSTLSIFLKTFIFAFAILTVICFGATTLLEKMGGIKPFEKKNGKDTPVLEDELDLDSLVDKHSPFFNAFKDTKRANILFLGVNGGLTDTIMLASFDMENKKVDVISVPRDTYYERPGFNSLAERKINSAYRGNPVNTAKAVSEVLCDIPINYYAVIEYDGVENIVDAMGGVPMDIPNINGTGGMYYNDPYDKPPLKIAIPAGHQVLDGKKAVQFLRFRHGYVNGDIGRVEAQQQFVKSAFKQTLSLNLPKIAKTVFQNVNSDITLGKAVSLAAKAAGMESGDMKTYTIPFDPEPQAPYYVYPKKKEIEQMIADIYNLKSYESDEEGSATDNDETDAD